MEIQKRKRSVVLLIATIIGILWLIYTWSYIGKTASTVSGDTSSTSIGTGIAMVLVMPHQILATLACFFAALGWLFKARWGALVAAILYTVALVLMLPWFYAVIIQMVLCYVSYARMGNKST